MDQAKQSSASLFNQTLVHGDEPIQTEIDPHEQSLMVHNQQMLRSIPHGKDLLHQDPSLAVFTDHDIIDEVGQNYGDTQKQRQIEFRGRDRRDTVREDRDIEDLKASMTLARYRGTIDEVGLKRSLQHTKITQITSN